MWAEAETSNCPMWDKKKLQMAPKGTCRWPELGHERWGLCLWDSRFKEGKNCCAIRAGREEWDEKREAALQAPSSVQEEGRRCSGHRAEFPCSQGEVYGEAGCPLCKRAGGPIGTCAGAMHWWAPFFIMSNLRYYLPSEATTAMAKDSYIKSTGLIQLTPEKWLVQP